MQILSCPTPVNYNALFPHSRLVCYIFSLVKNFKLLLIILKAAGDYCFMVGNSLWVVLCSDINISQLSTFRIWDKREMGGRQRQSIYYGFVSIANSFSCPPRFFFGISRTPILEGFYFPNWVSHEFLLFWLVTMGITSYQLYRITWKYGRNMLW